VEAPGFSPAKQRASDSPALAAEASRVAAAESSPGREPGVSSTTNSSSSLPKAGAQPLPAERHKEIFWEFVNAGKKLADLHVHYEQQPQYPLEKLWKPTAKLDYRVTKMRLSKDKSILFYNEALTLKGIPLETYEYRLGNRSALEWVIDQYQVSTDKRSGITNDPNRDDREYILRLIGQVITVGLETVHIVKSLPEFVIADSTAATGA
jgi:predicted helicase